MKAVLVTCLRWLQLTPRREPGVLDALETLGALLDAKAAARASSGLAAVLIDTLDTP